MRSTWDNSILLQQYLFSPKASKASLEKKWKDTSSEDLINKQEKNNWDEPAKHILIIPLSTWSIKRILFKCINKKIQTLSRLLSNFRIEAYPSVYSTCNNPRYASHLLPITFPQVKQRTGIIIFVYQFSIYNGEKNILKASLLHLFTSYLSEDSDILRKLNLGNR